MVNKKVRYIDSNGLFVDNCMVVYSEHDTIRVAIIAINQPIIVKILQNCTHDFMDCVLLLIFLISAKSISL